MTRAISYLRFSTKSQAAGDSRVRQKDKAKLYADEHGLQLDTRNYEDLGVSAFTGKNAASGALSKFIEAVDSGSIEPGTYLLVESLDRISRTQVDEALELFLSIIRRGIVIVTLTSPPQTYSSARLKDDRGMSLISSILEMIRANEESATKSVRVRSGLAAKRAAGKKREQCPKWLRLSPDRTKYEVIESEAAIVRQMFQWSAEGIGAHTISVRLNADENKKYHAPNVLRVLKSPAVIGTLVSRRGHEPLLNHYEPIISKELFYEVQANLKRRGIQKNGAAPDDVPNLFSGLLRCSACGESLRFNRKTRTSFAYLKCLNSLYKSGGCAAPGVQYDALENELLAFLLFDQDEELIKLATKKKPTKPSAKAEIAALEDQRNRLLDLVMNGHLLNTSTAAAKLNEVEAKIRALQESENLPAPIDEAREAVERAMSLFVEHEERSHDDDLTRYYEIRREIRAAFQRSIEIVSILGNEFKVKFVWD